MEQAVPAEVERVFRESHARAVATLTRSFGDLGLAEEAVQDAFVVALRTWPRDGMPPSPAGWILTTARNRAVDVLRREARRGDKHAQAAVLGAAGYLDGAEVAGLDIEAGVPGVNGVSGALEDDRLRLVFTCCHPALSREAQVALTLRMVGGLRTPEIARAFLVPEPTLAQRIVRAKNKIRDAGIPYRAPDRAELPERLGPVLAVVYLVFNEGYLAGSGDAASRAELCAEAIRLARLLVELMPDEPEVRGVLALMLLTESRRPARFDADDTVVRLFEQDRRLWDAALVAEGQDLVRQCLLRNQPGPYQLQAAIAAVHSDAASPAATDWGQVLALYDQLLAVAPTPVVALNRAVAVAEVHGPGAALSLVDGLDLDRYHLLHAVRADLLTRLGRREEARAAYDAALEGTANAGERALLTRRRADLGLPPG